jgi:hypothetical protein
MQTLLDIGAGDGNVTAELGKLVSGQIYGTEVSHFPYNAHRMSVVPERGMIILPIYLSSLSQASPLMLWWLTHIWYSNSNPNHNLNPNHTRPPPNPNPNPNPNLAGLSGDAVAVTITWLQMLGD